MKSQFTGQELPAEYGCKRCKNEGLDVCCCTFAPTRSTGRHIKAYEQPEVSELMEAPLGKRLRDGMELGAKLDS